MKFGCLARFYNPYKDEVEFAKKHEFDFMQLWYDDKGLALKEDTNPLQVISDEYFETIIHAVLDINDFDKHIPLLIDHMLYLKHKELIIHPICKSEKIEKDTINKLITVVKKASLKLKENHISVYIENNSKIDPILCTPEEIKLFFSELGDVGFLLDIAHVDSIDELKLIADIKYPDILHIADRRYSEVHEHLAIGDGDIDYKFIFSDILKDFDGKIIFEILDDKGVAESRDRIVGYLNR